MMITALTSTSGRDQRCASQVSLGLSVGLGGLFLFGLLFDLASDALGQIEGVGGRRPFHARTLEAIGYPALEREPQQVPEALSVVVCHAFHRCQQVNAQQLVLAQLERDGRSLRNLGHRSLQKLT